MVLRSTTLGEVVLHIMPRIIALDVGEKRVGVAVTDPIGLTAQPLTVLPRKPHSSFLKAISDLSIKYEADLVVLGLPRRTTGALGPESQKVLSLAYELKNRLNLKVQTFDERLTTVMAARVLDQAGLSKEKKKAVVDKTAAAIILEGYLAHQAVLAAQAKPGPETESQGDGLLGDEIKSP
jgi:putative Holliday junction resolvase